jgi:glycosyltransferase involved in cell wall biosynthesis
LGRLAARIAGVPAIIHTPHGLHFLGQRNPFKRQVFLRLEQVASRWGNHIVATSPSEQEALLRWKIAPAAQIVQIGNGIDSDALPANTDAAALRAAQGIPNDGPLIGTMARITAQKNPQLFLHAAAQVAAQIPAARFVWIGDGDMAEQARGLAGSLGIAERVTFLGYREQGAALLPMLDQFWLTSRFEGLPYALLEAMALGLPVVATDVVGNRDLVAAGRTGLLTPPDNPDALAQAAAYLIQHPVEAAALGRRGRTEVLAHHTARQMVERVTQLYLAALPPAGHAPILA